MAYDKIKFPAGEKITADSNGKLHVPDHPLIAYIEGDGIGSDITKASMHIWNSAIEKAYHGNRSIGWTEVFAGEKATKIYGEGVWLPEETMEAIKECRIAIKGPLTTPVGKGIRSLNVALRQSLDLYVCLRPVRHFAGVPSPVKAPEKTDMVVFRENTEDLYAGIEFPATDPGASELRCLVREQTGAVIREDAAISIKPISVWGSERILTYAFEYARRHNRSKVTAVHKANIMKATDGLYLDVARSVAKRYPDIEFDDKIVDAACMGLVMHPEDFDVLVLPNLYGDIVSDLSAGLVGGLGMAPGGNIGENCAIFEATHGTAPKYAGMDKVNPSSLALSGEMLLRHIGWTEAADLVVKGIEGAISRKLVTYDFARLMEGATELSCSGFANAVVEAM